MEPISKGDYEVKLLGAEGRVTHGCFHLEDLRGSCKLTLAFDQTNLSAISSDFFDALVQIRRRLEKQGLVPFCYGASRLVYPSDMSRTVANGLMAMRYESGQRCKEELVFIFHSGPDVEACSVAEQREFRQRWIAEWEPSTHGETQASPKLVA